ncbi:GFA family protein [Sphingomonas koreensis]
MTEGGCRCGAVRYRATGMPHATSLCHCTDCRKLCGGPSLAWVIFPEDQAAITKGELSLYESSPGVRWGFCGTCGTTLTYSRESRPGLFDFTTGSLDDPEAFPPAKEIWTGERLSWVMPDPALSQFERASA